MCSLDCCESCWLDQLSWHSPCSAHGRGNALLGDCGVCFPPELYHHWEDIFTCRGVHVLAGRWGCTRSGGYCVCLRRSHPQNSSRAAMAPQFSETVTSIILAYCLKPIANILSEQQGLEKHPPYSLCPDPCEKSSGTGRELGCSQTVMLECTCLAATYSQSCCRFGVLLLHLTQCFGCLTISKSYLALLRKQRDSAVVRNKYFKTAR